MAKVKGKDWVVVERDPEDRNRFGTLYFVEVTNGDSWWTTNLVHAARLDLATARGISRVLGALYRKHPAARAR
jgi:hypothetical protein